MHLTIYHFDEDTKEFLCTGQTHTDPVAGIEVLPRHATPLEPPEVGEDEVAVFSGDVETGGWTASVDHRGKDYWDEGTREYLGAVNFIGELPGGTTLTKPPLTLDEAKAAKLAAIQTEKIRVRDGGIVVDGVLYDTDERAMSAYTRVATFVFPSQPELEISDWKASDGVWVTMTKAKLEELVAAGYANEAAAFTWQKTRESEIAAATTTAEVEAISETFS